MSAMIPSPGNYSDPNEIRGMFDNIREKCHLVAAASSCSQLAVGCSLVLSLVYIDTRMMADGGEIYPVGDGIYGLSSQAIHKIGHCAGIEWDSRPPALGGCGQVGPTQDPCFVQFQAVGTIIEFDGAMRQKTGKKTMDLRDGTEALRAIRARCKTANGADKQIRDARLFIHEHAETKAKSRCIIHAFGLRRSYTMADLQKPFACIKPMFTGITNDPDLKLPLAMKVADHMLGGRAGLYSSGTKAEAALPAATTHYHAALPPVGADPDFDDGDLAELTTGPPTVIDAAQGSDPKALTQDDPLRAYSRFLLPGGRDKNKPITEVEDSSLKFWIDRITTNMANGSDRRGDDELKDAMQAVLAYRQGSQ